MFAWFCMNSPTCQSRLYVFRRPRLILESRSISWCLPWPHQVWNFQLRKQYRELEILGRNMLTWC